MDFDSIGDRLKDIQIRKSDNMENAKESMGEEVPKILSPEIYDVFHVFASMLDIKSFMKLAMTSKDMYNQCMNDKKIRISVNDDSVTAFSRHRVVFSSTNVHHELINSYAAALCKLPCNVNLCSLDIHCRTLINDVSNYLKEIRVKKIEELTVRHECPDFQTMLSLTEDFEVTSLNISVENDASLPVLRSILQLNLKKLCCNGLIPVNFIHEVDSSIGELHLPHIMGKIRKDDFMHILSKIQSGSLSRLFLSTHAIDWKHYTTCFFEYNRPIPEDRPLLFVKYSGPFPYENWFLHWNGDVTKCILRNDTLECYKCEPWELPHTLRNDEEILKSLKEKRQRISCKSEQFNNFITILTMIEHSYKGPLPDHRPLHCKVNEHSFWMLDKDDSLMECAWEDNCATWKPFNPSKPVYIKHPALAKYMFWKYVKQAEGPCLSLNCLRREQFDSWFEDIEKLDFEYSGALPSSRPLVFERPLEEGDHLCIVLLDDRLVQCLFENARFGYADKVHIQLCLYWNRPAILLSSKHAMEILMNPNCKDMNVGMDFDVFRDGLHQLKHTVRESRLVVAEKTETKFFYWLNGFARKVTWENGRLHSKADLHESPPNFMKQVFRYFAEHFGDYEELYHTNFTMDLGQIRSCLEQFTTVPFDYAGPLKSDSPLAFVKNDIQHTCYTRTKCHCSEVSVHVWFVWDGTRLTKCSWRDHESKAVHFETSTLVQNAPPLLKSREYLKNLIQAKYDESSHFEWFGEWDEFRAYIKDYPKLPFDYDGRLPEKRPLLFTSSDREDRCYFLLREDGIVIKCELSHHYIRLTLPSPINYFVPPALISVP